MFLKNVANKSLAKRVFHIGLAAAVVLPYLVYGTLRAEAVNEYSSVSNALADSRPSQTGVTYTINATPSGTAAIQCVQMVFSTTASGSTEPTNMTTKAGGAAGSLSGGGLTAGNWTFYNSGTDGTVQYEYATGEATTATAITFSNTNVTNASSAGVYYLTITSYSTLATHTCSGAIDTKTVAFAVTNGVTATASIDPTLSFAVNAVNNTAQTVNGTSTTVTTTSTTIPFGTVTTSANSVGAHDLVVTTNAQSGYTVYVKYTGAMSNGSHNITDWTGTNASPTTFSAAGTEALGYTTASTTLGTGTASRFSGGKWAAFTTSNAEVAHNSAAVASDTTRIGYQLGISGTTPAGSYTTTVVLTATPTY